jgi:hypothetical protein
MNLTDRDKLEIEQLYRRFNMVPTDRENNLIISFTNFQGQVVFPSGTKKEEVEDYFERIYPGIIRPLDNKN